MSAQDTPEHSAREPGPRERVEHGPGPREPCRAPAPGAETSVLPAGGLPCLWMSAGLLAWRLCDREYDCEHCPLDAALGGTPALERSCSDSGAGDRLEFPDDRLYSSSHGWIQPQANGNARLGLDPFVTRLLDRVSAVVLPAIGSRLQRGEPLCWLVDEGVPIPLPCPIAGVVERVNPSVQADPRLLSTSACERGWLAELSTAGDLSRLRGLADASDQRVLAGRRLRDLRRRGARRAARARGAVGPTLCDGGLRVRSLRRVLGTPAYHRIVRRLLG